MCMYVVICKIDHCIHIQWCIPMGLGHNDPWVESHMWPQQTWGQRSSRGQWPLVQVFGKKGQCIHILWCIFKSNITMIAKVCDRESRRDLWFENCLVWLKMDLILAVWGCIAPLAPPGCWPAKGHCSNQGNRGDCSAYPIPLLTAPAVLLVIFPIF